MEWTVITEQITVIKSPGIPASTALSLASSGPVLGRKGAGRGAKREWQAVFL